MEFVKNFMNMTFVESCRKIWLKWESCEIFSFFFFFNILEILFSNLQEDMKKYVWIVVCKYWKWMARYNQFLEEKFE